MPAFRHHTHRVLPLLLPELLIARGSLASAARIHEHGLIAVDRRKDWERYLKTALAQSAKVTRLAHELFELARLEHDASTLESEPFSLADLVHDVIQELGLLAAEKQQRLLMDVPPNLPNVEGSLRLIDRALTNLIGNAIQHTPANGEIRVALRAVAGGVEVAVHDDGPGIPPEVRDALLTPPLLSARRATMGLGLQIVRRIVELHGSRLELEVAARGTRVRFEFRAALSAVGRS